MKIVGVKEFRDKATMLLRGEEPILITRHGRPAGIYAPLEGGELPLELREELFRLVTERVWRSLKEGRHRDEHREAKGRGEEEEGTVK